MPFAISSTLRLTSDELLPPDDESNGFDNIADVLRVSPSLLEQYLAAARKISAMAVGDPTFIPVTQVYRAPPDRAQDRHIEGLPLGHARRTADQGQLSARCRIPDQYRAAA